MTESTSNECAKNSGLAEAFRRSRIDALLGACAGDALAMPVHWYYDRSALRRDYGEIRMFDAPRNPHPDSILWRSQFTPRNARGDILREQAKFWGRRGVHYHQFLQAGENTLNFRLAMQLYRQVSDMGRYDAGAWLDTYVAFMLEPGNHRDTYVEEYHRNFFDRYAGGRELLKCGGEDIHIGGLAPVPALFAALPGVDETGIRRTVREHVSITHRHPGVLAAADSLVRILFSIEAGASVRDAIADSHAVSIRNFQRWEREPDEEVIGRRLSPACYIDDAFPAALFLAWKYAADFSGGIRANARVGGDNCHRAAVTGSILGFALGVPEEWIAGLVELPTGRCAEPAP